MKVSPLYEIDGDHNKVNQLLTNTYLHGLTQETPWKIFIPTPTLGSKWFLILNQNIYTHTYQGGRLIEI